MAKNAEAPNRNNSCEGCQALLVNCRYKTTKEEAETQRKYVEKIKWKKPSSNSAQEALLQLAENNLAVKRAKRDELRRECKQK